MEAIEKTFTPNLEAVWLSKRVVEYAAKWMADEQGICWVEHVEFGRVLSETTGTPYYQRGGLNAAGKLLEDHPAATALIASIASNAEGRNMQAWNKNLVISRRQRARSGSSSSAELTATAKKPTKLSARS